MKKAEREITRMEYCLDKRDKIVDVELLVTNFVEGNVIAWHPLLGEVIINKSQ